MFKLISSTITTIMLLLFLAIGLAFWKGGEPFRVIGEGMITIGEKVWNVGNLVDEMIDGGKKVKKSYNEFKEVIVTEEKE